MGGGGAYNIPTNAAYSCHNASKFEIQNRDVKFEENQISYNQSRSNYLFVHSLNSFNSFYFPLD